jgi:hypothetical protein
VGIISEFLDQGKLGLQLKLKNGTDLRRGCFTQNFRNTKLGFCIKVIYRHHMSPHNFSGIFKELFKIVVVQQKHLMH